MQNGIIAQNTEFGWILSGTCSNSIMPNKNKIISMTTRTSEVQQINKFRELKEVPKNYRLSNDDQTRKSLYEEATVRNPDGTYTLQLPYSNPDKDYRKITKLAAARRIQPERRFAENNTLQNQNQAFSEHLDMGSTKKVTQEDYGQGKYYLQAEIQRAIPIKETDGRTNSVGKAQVNISSIHENGNRKQHKKIRIRPIWMLLLVLILQIFSGSHCMTSYSIQTLQPGFYVEQIEKNIEVCGNAQVVMTETHCEELLHYFAEQEYNFGRIREYLSISNHRRKKTGFLGHILTTTFGVNDELYKIFESLNQNHKRLIEATNH